MTTLAELPTSMTDAAGVIFGAELETRSPGESWTVTVNPAVAVAIDLDPATLNLMLATEVGGVNPVREADYLKLMLTYNSAWEDTGGLRFSIDPFEGTATLQFPLAVEEATAEMLARVIGNLADRTTTWREALESEGSPDVPVIDEGDDGVVFRA
ncbi:MAG: type III secretion system chaperone [Pseudomonadota bacterium]